MQAGILEHRNDVDDLVSKRQQKQLVDSEYNRRKRETGERVKKRREELGYTRTELSKITDISESTDLVYRIGA